MRKISLKSNDVTNEKTFTLGGPKIDKKRRNTKIVKKNNLALKIFKRIFCCN